MTQSADKTHRPLINERTALGLIGVLVIIGISVYIRLGFELRRNPMGRRVYFKCAPDTVAPADRDNAPHSVAEEFRLDLNRATQEELLRIPDIGPVTAKRIIDYRETVKNFDNIDELTKVKGIGNKKLEKLRIYLIIKDK